MNDRDIKPKSVKQPSGRLIAEPPKPVIKEGEYLGVIQGWEVHRMFDRMKLLIQVSIQSIEYDEIITLTYFANLKCNEEGELIEPRRTTTFSKLLHNLWPGTDFIECNLKNLTGMKCKVVVVTVKSDMRRNPLIERKYYSKIKEIFRDDSDDVPF